MWKRTSVLLVGVCLVARADNPNCDPANYTQSKRFQALSLSGTHSAVPAPLAFTHDDFRSPGNGGFTDYVSGEPDICMQIGAEDRSHDFIWADPASGEIQARVLTGTGVDAWQNNVVVEVYYDRATPASTEDEDSTYPADWKIVLDFEENNPSDASGNGITGTDSGSPTLRTHGGPEACPIGNCLEFNGTGARVHFGPNSIIQGINNDYTIFAVEYDFATTSGENTLWENSISGSPGELWRLVLHGGSGEVQWGGVSNGVSRRQGCGAISFTSGQWESVGLRVRQSTPEKIACWNGAAFGTEVTLGTSPTPALSNDEATAGWSRWPVFDDGRQTRIDTIIVVAAALDQAYITDFALANLDPASFWEPVGSGRAPETLFIVEGATVAEAQTTTECDSVCAAEWDAAGLGADAFDLAPIHHQHGDACNCFDLPFPETRTVP